MGKVIVAGVDGSADSQRALSWAVDEARIRGDELMVVHAWEYPVSYYNVPVAVERPAVETLAGCLAQVDTHDVKVTSRLVEGRPVRVLVQAAEGADLLVVGSRGHSGLATTILGSVSTGCVHQAPCPVAVIPPPRKSRSRVGPTEASP
jgi:nucleotide-binding universal stress UspA family protein